MPKMFFEKAAGVKREGAGSFVGGTNTVGFGPVLGLKNDHRFKKKRGSKRES